MIAFRRASAVDEIFSIIKDKIHQGEYPVGHVLSPQKIMAGFLEKQGQAVLAGDSAMFTNYDKAFHMELTLIGGNPILIQYMEIIREGLFRFIEASNKMTQVVNSAAEFHRDILLHLENRNGLAAERKMVEHLWEVATIFEANLGHDLGLNSLFRREMNSFDR